MEGSGDDPSKGQRTDKEKLDNSIKDEDVFVQPSSEQSVSSDDSQTVADSNTTEDELVTGTNRSTVKSDDLGSTDSGEWITEQEGTNQRIRHSSGNKSVSGMVLRSSTSSTGSQPDMTRTTPVGVDQRLVQSDILHPSTSGNSLTQSTDSTNNTDTSALNTHSSEPDVRPRTRNPSFPRSSQSLHADIDKTLPAVTTRRPKSAVRSQTQTFTEREERSERRYSGSPINPRSRHRSSAESENPATLTPVYGIPNRSPRDISQQSEEVLRNFFYETHNRESERTEGEMIPSPEILNHFSPQPASNTAQVGRRLADIGDRVNDQYSSEFRQMSQLLNIRPGERALETIYDVFKDVCAKLFTHGINWGRVVALLQFGYYMAMNYLKSGEDLMSSIIRLLLRFMAEQKIYDTLRKLKVTISEWIASQGGWQAALTEVGNSVNPYYFFAAVVLGTAALTGLYFWYKH